MADYFGNGLVEISGMEIIDDDAEENLENMYHHTIKPLNKEKYSCRVLLVIQIMYIISVVLWLLLIYSCGLYINMDVVTGILLLIPILVFGIGFYNSCAVTGDIEETMLGANYLSFGFLITIILINWNSPIKEYNKNKFFKLLIIAFILIMVSMIDIWVNRENLSIVRHFKSILNTAALVILSVSLYSYYRAQRDHNIN